MSGSCSDEEIAVFLPACSRVCVGATGNCLGFGLSEHWWLFLGGRNEDGSAQTQLGGGRSEHRGAHVVGIIWY